MKAYREYDRAEGVWDQMSAAVDVGRMPIEVTGRGRAAPKCGVASAYSHIPNSSIGRNNSIGWKTTKI